jgi:aryl-alcohol dehydrogenase-like predicted oxidoreductase
MRYRDLGKTGIKVSEIGFGAWGIGGATEGATSYGNTDDKESKKALIKAYEKGINFFDTSNVYGNGHSEELLGKTFESLRKNVIIASKVGLLRHNGPQDFTSKYIIKSLDETLERLRTDYLDLYQLHSPPIKLIEEMPETINTLSKLKEKGKIRAFGISARSPEEGIIAAEKYPFDSIQINFNLVDQRAVESGLIDICNKKRIGIIGRTPLCFGFLSGRYGKDYKFSPKDHRSTWVKEQRDVWANAYNLFLEAVDKNINQTNAQIALRYCLSYSSVSTIIPGMLNEKEVIENTRASDLGVLEKQEVSRLEDIFKENDFFLGKKPFDK